MEKLLKYAGVKQVIIILQGIRGLYIWFRNVFQFVHYLVIQYLLNIKI